MQTIPPQALFASLLLLLGSLCAPACEHVPRVTPEDASTLGDGGHRAIWSRIFGGKFANDGTSVTTDPAGNIYLTGFFNGSMNLGGADLTSSSLDIFLASFTPGGAHRWSRAFGSPGSDVGWGVATDSKGNVFLTGAVDGAVDFGGGAVGAGSLDIFLASFSSKGAHRWSKVFAGKLRQEGRAVATDSQGNVYLTGGMEGELDFGGGVVGTSSTAARANIFLASFSPGGTYRWSKWFGDDADDRGGGLAVDSGDNVYLTGDLLGQVDFGGGSVTSRGRDAFVASYSHDGLHRWSRSFGGPETDMGLGAAVDSGGNLYVTGTFSGTHDLDATIKSKGANDIFVTSFTPSGAHRWTKTFGSSTAEVGRAIAADRSGGIYVTGDFAGSIDLGAEAIAPRGGDDIFVLALGTDGALRWTKTFGSLSQEVGKSVAVAGAGAVYITGKFGGKIDFGNGGVAANGLDSIFLLKVTGAP